MIRISSTLTKGTEVAVTRRRCWSLKSTDDICDTPKWNVRDGLYKAWVTCRTTNSRSAQYSVDNIDETTTHTHRKLRHLPDMAMPFSVDGNGSGLNLSPRASLGISGHLSLYCLIPELLCYTAEFSYSIWDQAPFGLLSFSLCWLL